MFAGCFETEIYSVISRVRGPAPQINKNSDRREAAFALWLTSLAYQNLIAGIQQMELWRRVAKDF